jgi:ribosome biogenesis protein UTP30
MRKGDLKRQIESALRCTYLHISGQSCAVKVGHTSMSESHILDNACAAIGDIGEAVPGKWPAIQTLHLKSAESVALPLYNSLPDGARAADSPEDELIQPPKPKRAKGSLREKEQPVAAAPAAKAGKAKKRAPKAIK